MDVTEHPTTEGKAYLAVVLDAWNRRVVGWSIADRIDAWYNPCRRHNYRKMVSPVDQTVHAEA
jgi:transposase InsO family protein